MSRQSWGGVLELRQAGGSYTAIAATLDAEGIRPCRAAAWSATAVRNLELRAATGITGLKATQHAAHEAVQAAEAALMTEEARPASRERWQRMAHAFERRALAWQALAEVGDRDSYGHAPRAMRLAANADLDRARLLRHRLGVSR